MFRQKRLIFPRIFRHSDKFFVNFHENSRDIGIRTVSGISATVGVHACANTVVGVPTIASIPVLSGLCL